MITRPATPADVPARPGTLGLPPCPRVPTDLCCSNCGEVRTLIPVRVVSCTRAGGYERNDRRAESWCEGCIEAADEEIEEL